MSYKTISTVLVIIAATALLTTLALKVRICVTADQGGKGQTARGCCAIGGGCASIRQNQAKGE